MKTIIVFYKGIEVIRVECDEIIFMCGGFRLIKNDKEVARFLNDYDYALSEDSNKTFVINGSDLIGTYGCTITSKV